MASMNAFMFFNSGFNSGASIMHKHMQIIPYSSMGSEGGLVPVEEAALNHIQ
jgi:ATP adenylyltransferase/5',5'''-P-1,P-4-tetraphosphate phosphorylase II